MSNTRSKVGGRALLKSQIDLLSLAEGFLESRIVLSLARLKAFDAIGDGEKSIEEIAGRLGVPAGSLARVLNAGVVLGVLASEDGTRYSVRPEWHAVLLASNEDGYLGNWLGFLDYLYDVIGHLDEAVRRGGSIVDVLTDDTEDKQDRIREFTLAMHNYAALRGQELVHFLDTSDCRTLLDMGCGPGTYAFHLAMANPELELYLSDLPEVLEVAREVQANYPLTADVHYLPLDVLEEEIPGTYDMVLVSNTLHMLGEESSRRLLERLYDNVVPGGSLVVQAQYLNNDRLGGRWPIFLDLIQMSITPNGHNHTPEETIRWMEDAGFTDIGFKRMTVFNTNSYLQGYRAA